MGATAELDFIGYNCSSYQFATAIEYVHVIWAPTDSTSGKHSFSRVPISGVHMASGYLFDAPCRLDIL